MQKSGSVLPRSAEKFIKELARDAGTLVLKRFGKDGVHYAKSAHAWDVVTQADLASEKLIISRIKKAYPAHGIIAEESGKLNEGAEYVWIIDPIDGTMNFSRHVPLFGVMLCLTHKGKPILSAINMPATGEFFFAKAGGGAFCNGKRIRCSTHRTVGESVGCGSSTLRDRLAAFFRRVLDVKGGYENIHFVSTGAMANNACYTAAGRRDWMMAVNGSVWDFAPAYLMLTEAGCKVTGMSGERWTLDTPGFIAANPALHKQLVRLTTGV